MPHAMIPPTIISLTVRSPSNYWSDISLMIISPLLLLISPSYPQDHSLHPYIIILVGGLEPWNFMTFHLLEFHHPNWRTHIFQRGWLKPPSSVSFVVISHHGIFFDLMTKVSLRESVAIPRGPRLGDHPVTQRLPWGSWLYRHTPSPQSSP